MAQTRLCKVKNEEYVCLQVKLMFEFISGYLYKKYQHKNSPHQKCSNKSKCELDNFMLKRLQFILRLIEKNLMDL